MIYTILYIHDFQIYLIIFKNILYTPFGILKYVSIYFQSMRQPELNLDSFYYLMDFIELQIAHTIHPENYYRQIDTSSRTKTEIIK
jgi:hypothetical protein